MQDDSSPPRPPRPPRTADEPASAYNTRLGLWFFAGYCVFYGGFMGMSAFAPQLMGRAPFGGVNLAILYGMGLIVAAVALALVYVFLCRPPEPTPIAPDAADRAALEEGGGA